MRRCVDEAKIGQRRAGQSGYCSLADVLERVRSIGREDVVAEFPKLPSC